MRADGHGRNWARTSDLQLVELALSQLSYAPAVGEFSLSDAASEGSADGASSVSEPFQWAVLPIRTSDPTRSAGFSRRFSVSV
jgi:hypothetical protein